MAESLSGRIVLVSCGDSGDPFIRISGFDTPVRIDGHSFNKDMLVAVALFAYQNALEVKVTLQVDGNGKRKGGADYVLVSRIEIGK